MNKGLKIATISVGSLIVLAVATTLTLRLHSTTQTTTSASHKPHITSKKSSASRGISVVPGPSSTAQGPAEKPGDWTWTYTPVKELGTGDGQQFWLTNVTVKNSSSTAINLSIVEIGVNGQLQDSPGWNSAPAGNDQMTWPTLLGQHPLFGTASSSSSFPTYPDESPVAVPLPAHRSISGDVVIPVPIGQSHQSFLYFHVTAQIGNGQTGYEEPMGSIQLPAKGA